MCYSTEDYQWIPLRPEQNVGHLPVVQEGKMIGIVTRTDILTYYYDLLPD